jgi:DNA-binding HxlR family transcriptional regulator
MKLTTWIKIYAYLCDVYQYYNSMRQKITADIPQECSKVFMAIKDSMELLSGKWKIQIIGVLLYKGRIRFMDLLREVDGIGAKMLSKELQELEINELVKRTVWHTKPITVEYEITENGKTMGPMITEIIRWGIEHRKRVFRKSK